MKKVLTNLLCMYVSHNLILSKASLSLFISLSLYISLSLSLSLRRFFSRELSSFFSGSEVKRTIDRICEDRLYEYLTREDKANRRSRTILSPKRLSITRTSGTIPKPIRLSLRKLIWRGPTCGKLISLTRQKSIFYRCLQTS